MQRLCGLGKDAQVLETTTKNYKVDVCRKLKENAIAYLEETTTKNYKDLVEMVSKLLYSRSNRNNNKELQDGARMGVVVEAYELYRRNNNKELQAS